MTQDEIIKLARKVGLPHWYQTKEVVNIKLLQEFAKLIIEHEREKCAALCDELDKKYWQATGELMSGYGDAIRERGQQ
jgi:acyl-CoA reductase-like NAD-dependent aldehyde dehydrogenase